MTQDRNITPTPFCAGPSLATRLPALCVVVLLSSGRLYGVLGRQPVVVRADL